MVDRMKWNMEIPADFMAASSKRSPRLPYNMMERQQGGQWKSQGIILADAYNNNFPYDPPFKSFTDQIFYIFPTGTGSAG